MCCWTAAATALLTAAAAAATARRTIDFLTLSTLAPFWMSNDAALRKWDKQDSLLPALCVLPVLGPAIYLCLRPRAQL